MATYTLPARTLPLDDSWDVIVLGGGPAGCAAAASAAREGARTLLVESTGCLGGMGTSALVPAWCPFSDREKIIYRGLAERVLTECKAGMPHVAPEMLDWVPIDPERLKRVYDGLVTGFGASVLFQTLLCTVDRDETGNVTAIVTASKAGLTSCQARVYIDATGDADLAAWAGASFDKGEQKELMPATHCFVLTNVNEPAFRRGPYLHPMNPKSPIYAVVQSGRYPEIPDTHLCCSLIGPGTVGFNAGHLWNVDNTEPETVSRALIAGRRMAKAYRDALAEFHPDAFGNAFLVNTGSLMGVRETRRILGDYRLTLKDYLERRSFPDEICRNAYFLDVHPKVTEAVRDIEGQDGWESRSLRYLPGESHGVPYGCLVPQGLTNVLVAGRSISCEQVVQGSIRVMPVCLAMGEAAGMAAAVAAQSHGGDVRAVDITDLRARLREAGAYLP